MKRKTNLTTNKSILLKIIKEILSLTNPVEGNISKVISKNPSLELKTFSKAQIIKAYELYKRDIKLSQNDKLRFLSLIRMKKIRTLSGVTPVTVLTKPYPCPGKCIYCPNDPNMPKSYLSLEPGAQRALSNKFDPYLQVYNRLVAYKKIGHPTDKVELIVLGGTWSYYPKNYQIWFIKRCFDAMNSFNFKSHEYVNKVKLEQKCSWKDLVESQKINEKAQTRCVGLVLETRPDYITKEEIIRLRRLGATKVQIGVQSLNDKVLKINKRGHNSKATANAFELLRLGGFKIHAHWMPNLLGSNPKKDVEDFKKLFSDDRFKPDELKIYPCSLIKNTKLFDYCKQKKWEPYSDTQLLYILETCLLLTPRYCRITRIIRDISSEDIVVGNKKSNFRQIVEKEIEKSSRKIKEIRYREIKNVDIKIKDLILKVTTYKTKTSQEYFLEYITNSDKIVGFLRLSPPKVKPFIKELKGSGIIREVHVYGQTIAIGKEAEGKAQHLGLGKALIKEAVNIAKDNNFKEICVISSVGTRKYYRKIGFKDGVLYQHLDIN